MVETSQTHSFTKRKSESGLGLVEGPDFRQKIADSWPASIDDSSAREDWGWSHKFDLESMTKDMIEHLS